MTDNDDRDQRWVTLYDEDALALMSGWTGGTNDPLYAIMSSGGANYAWVFQDAIENLDADISSVKKLGRNKFQLGKGTFTKKEIDELHTIRDALVIALESAGDYDDSGRHSWKPSEASTRETRRRPGDPRKYYIVEQVQNGLWYQVGHFYFKGDAERFKAKIPGKTRIVHTWPSIDRPVVREETPRGGAQGYRNGNNDVGAGIMVWVSDDTPMRLTKPNNMSRSAAEQRVTKWWGTARRGYGHDQPLSFNWIDENTADIDYSWHRARETTRVADFNTLHDLIAHAARELGATHVSGHDAHTKIYFPRGGQYPYEEASVWRKGGYWHAEGPHARTGVEALPSDAQPIGGTGGSRRAAEARGVVSQAPRHSSRPQITISNVKSRHARPQKRSNRITHRQRR